jgi:hypothetical protein
MANTLTKLDTVTVGAGGAASVTFSNIPQTYTDLVVKISARDLSSNAIGETLAFRINGDSSAIYNRRRLEAVGTSVSSGAWTGDNYAYVGVTNGGGTTANTFDSFELYLPNYVGSNYKSYSVDCVTENNSATNNVMDLYAGLWSSTAPVTSLTFYEIGTANFAQYTTFTLYGVFKEDVSVAPAVPTIGTATDGGTGTTASVAFTPVSGAASYTATSTPGSFTGTALTTPVTVGGLTAGTAYTFKVKANNPIGSSGESAASNSVTILAGGAYESIASVSPTTGTSVTFSSIPSTYKHLQIRILGRTDYSSTNDSVNVRFNGDSGSNYSYHAIQGAAGGMSTAGVASTTGVLLNNGLAGGTAGTSVFGADIIDIHDYSSTSKNKTVRAFNGRENNTSVSVIGIRSGAWYSTSAVTSITLTFNGNAQSGSVFALYGIQG